MGENWKMRARRPVPPRGAGIAQWKAWKQGQRNGAANGRAPIRADDDEKVGAVVGRMDTESKTRLARAVLSALDAGASLVSVGITGLVMWVTRALSRWALKHMRKLVAGVMGVGLVLFAAAAGAACGAAADAAMGVGQNGGGDGQT